jgi:hypothetical protein|tara:strand:- start:733 stop:1344 length:612 start_codon:yes stop_codon:yes gene_type:complete
LATQLGALANQPDNINFLSPLGFNFFIKKLPNTNYFVQSVNIPSIQLGDASIQTPFSRIPLIGDHMEFGDVQLSFKVDEDLTNYVELFNWITQLGFPESFEQSKFIYEQGASAGTVGSGPNLDFNGEGQYSDAVLTILNSAMKPNLEVQFEDAYPDSLSDVQFTTTAGSVDYLECTVTFKYRLFRIMRLSSSGTNDTQTAPVR